MRWRGRGLCGSGAFGFDREPGLGSAFSQVRRQFIHVDSRLAQQLPYVTAALAGAQRFDAFALRARHRIQAVVFAAVERDGPILDVDLEGFAVFDAGVAPGFADRRAVQQGFDVFALLGRGALGGGPAARRRGAAPGLGLVIHGRNRSSPCQKKPALAGFLRSP
ncbi:hypothetical protein D9M68_750680 [compost metagenome]